MADLITLDELVDSLAKNVKEDIKQFEDIVNLEGALNREIYINDIEYGLGQSVDGYIRYWNEYDEKHSIPIKDRKPIKLYIDSYGGDLVEAFTIINAIELSKTPIVGICIGAAYSSGFFIFITCPKRIAYPLSSFLYHEGSAQNGGTANQFQNFATFYKKQLEQLKNHVLKYTKIDKDLYKDIQKEDFWMTAQEALELGVCDAIIEKGYLKEKIWEK